MLSASQSTAALRTPPQLRGQPGSIIGFGSRRGGVTSETAPVAENKLSCSSDRSPDEKTLTETVASSLPMILVRHVRLRSSSSGLTERGSPDHRACGLTIHSRNKGCCLQQCQYRPLSPCSGSRGSCSSSVRIEQTRTLRYHQRGWMVRLDLGS